MDFCHWDYDIQEAELISLQPYELFYYVISGSARTGKSNAICLLALESIACGYEVYLIDNAAGMLSACAIEHSINYQTTADQIYE